LHILEIARDKEVPRQFVVNDLEALVKKIQRKDRKFAKEYLNYPEEDLSIFINEVLGVEPKIKEETEK
jgi:hypothetical protein